MASTGLKMPFHPTTFGPINKITYSEDYVKANPTKFKVENRVKGDELLNALDTITSHFAFCISNSFTRYE